ncbi:MAG TPA: hypothetical protein PKD85_09220, partial [Saprospiraceae bacterium]|nr:hypothetical protein [Saprospiraceae bacterium]
VHSFKIFGFAVIDTVLTLLLAYLIARYFNLKGGLNTLYIFSVLIVLSVFIHKLFCVDTHLTKIVDGFLSK